MRKPVILAIGAVLALSAVPARSQQIPSTPSTYATDCPVGVRKLQVGIEVIGAPESRLAAAREALAMAQQQAQRGEYYYCTETVRAGLRALDAG
jgi:hypothetical protein